MFHFAVSVFSGANLMRGSTGKKSRILSRSNFPASRENVGKCKLCSPEMRLFDPFSKKLTKCRHVRDGIFFDFSLRRTEKY
jgi:hypothetical protein